MLVLLMPAFAQAQYYSITFRLDMSDYTANFTTPEVNGTFNNWCGASCHPMSDPDGDDIWEVTVDSITATFIEYKFAHDNWSGQELLVPGSACTQTVGTFTNRILNITGNATLPIVCWGSCSACAGSPISKNVIFKVDMSDYVPTYNQVFVAGNFNSFCGICNELFDGDGDGIYEGLVSVPAAYDTILYKFVVDNFNDDETLLPGDPCTFTSSGFTNRIAILNGDTTLPSVCWSSCASCGSGPTSANILFQIDLSEYTGPSYNMVNLNGTFNNWCGSCAVMTDANNDSIFELSVTLPIGDTIQYKFTLDGWTVDEQLTSGDPCTFTDGNFVNRLHIVSGDQSLLPVCWASCDVCDIFSAVDFNALSVKVYPNPAKHIINLDLSAIGHLQNAEVKFFNTMGQQVLETVVNGKEAQINVEHLPVGVYTGEVKNKELVFRFNWIKHN